MDDVSSITGIPNRPVSRGIITLPPSMTPSTGTGRIMHPSPKIPESRKANAPCGSLPRALSPFSSTAHAMTRTNGVRESNVSAAPFSRTHWSGTAMRMDAEHPTRLPMAAARTASIPLPSRRSRCPGRTDTASSESGAPMNTDGTKSTNEWTTDAAMMQHPAAMAACSGSSGSNAWMEALKASIIAARVLTWMPGTMPLNRPMRHPAAAMPMQIAIIAGSMSASRRYA